MTFGEWVDDVIAMPLRIKEMVQRMADESQVIQAIADALNSNVFPAVQALIAENQSLREAAAADATAEVAESEAVAQVQRATDQLVEILSPDDLPTVNPL